MDQLHKLMLDKSGQRVNSAGQVIDSDGKPVEGAAESTVHSTYQIGEFSGERAIELAFHVQGVLQTHMVSAQGQMVDMLDADDRAAVAKEGKEMDEEMRLKYGGQLRKIQGEILGKLPPGEMFKLTKMLFEQVTINNQNGVQALGTHFRKNMSHILPVLKEVIRVNDFLDLDMTALL